MDNSIQIHILFKIFRAKEDIVWTISNSNQLKIFELKKVAMFISSLPSSRAHFPYQAGLCGNRSPPDPLSLSARATCEPPHHCPAPAHPSRCCRPGHCLGLHPDVRLTGQPDPPPPLLLYLVPCPTPAPQPLPSYVCQARVRACRRHNTEPSLSSCLQPSRTPFLSTEQGHHLLTSPSAAARDMSAVVLQQLGRAELAAP
jgi:hypothetical protein